MTIANQLYEKAFHSTREPRSDSYRAGVLDTLNFKESGTELNHPFEPGKKLTSLIRSSMTSQKPEHTAR
jgi:hypothetical protein